MHRAVIHLNDAAPEKIQTVLQNTTNLLAALGPETQVELVTHGPGIAVATNPAAEEITTQLTALLAAGVTLCVCQNTMTARRLTPRGHPPAGGGRGLRCRPPRHPTERRMVLPAPLTPPPGTG